MVARKGYKLTEAGEIPEDWRVQPVENLCSITTGGRNTQDSIADGAYPFFVRSQTVERINSYSFDGEAVLTAGDGVGTGKIFHYINGKCDVHQRVYLMSHFSGNLLGYYFFLYFSANFYDRITQMTAKSSVDSVRREMIARMPIPVPSIEEQTAIATALSDADALIETLEQSIAKKRHIKQGAMQELLTGKKRLPGFGEKNQKYKLTEVGEIPEDWIVMSLGGLATIKDGTHQTPRYVTDGIPFYSVENITRNDFENIKYISRMEHSFLTRYFKIEKNDILMTRIGSIGECKLIDWEVEASFYVSLALLKIKNGFSSPYVLQYSKSDAFKCEVELHSLPCAAPKKINLGPISDIRMVLPAEKNEQTVIAAVLSDMDDEIAALEAKLIKARQIKAGMMQELLTGRIRLI